MVSGMVNTSRYPRAAATCASAMPVFPLVGSRMMVSGLIRPASSAASIRATPSRSFTLAAGLKDSSLATTSAPAPSVTRFNRTRGVLPISCVMFSAMLTVAIPANVDVDCNVGGDGESHWGELFRRLGCHPGQHPAGDSVRCRRGQRCRRGARSWAHVEVGTRFDDPLDGETVGVNQ